MRMHIVNNITFLYVIPISYYNIFNSLCSIDEVIRRLSLELSDNKSEDILEFKRVRFFDVL